MSLIDTLRARALASMKAKDTVQTTILRLAQSEVQALEERAGRALSDDEALGAIRKLIKSNEETLAAMGSGSAESEQLKRELQILSEFLPKGLSVEEIVAALAPVAEAIRGAGNDGQATGAAMKHLKSVGAVVQGTDVAKAVKALRS